MLLKSGSSRTRPGGNGDVAWRIERARLRQAECAGQTQKAFYVSGTITFSCAAIAS